MLFYLYDVSEYMTRMRDFYFGTAMLPGFTAQTQSKLEECLKWFERSESRRKRAIKI